MANERGCDDPEPPVLPLGCVELGEGGGGEEQGKIVVV
jgi:hypothetical protein